MKSRKIFAMGGGGFSSEPENLLLDEFILSLSESSCPNICFVPTASKDSELYIARFLEFFSQFACSPSVLRAWSDAPINLNFLSSVDILYVGGGNTDLMLKRWKQKGLIEAIRSAYDAGTVLVGISAGSLCWFEWGVTDSFGADDFLSCLGWLKGSNCVHYEIEGTRRQAYLDLIRAGKVGGLALEDGVGILYRNEEQAEIVSSSPDARAYEISAEGTKVNERSIQPRYLGEGKSGVVVRRASKSDAAGIHDAHMRSIERVCRPHYTEEQINAWQRPLDEELLQNLISKNAFWTVTIDGTTEGFGNVFLSASEPSVAEIGGLYLSDIAIGKGIGRRLYRGMERYIWELEKSQVRLYSTVNARPFYEKMGFKISGEETQHIMRGVPIPWVPMQKILD